MKRAWIFVAIPVALLLGASLSRAGPNAGATARLCWGNSFADSLTSLTLRPGVDTTLTLFVSILGLRELRGIDIQLAILGGEGPKPSALPPAWKFQSGAPCDNEDHVTATPRFPGCAVSGATALITALCGIFEGATGRFEAFSGMSFAALTAASGGLLTRDPARRYGLFKVTLTVQGSKCPGAEKPVCIRPSLRMGHDHDHGPVLGIVDQKLQYDFIPFEPGYDRLTVNPGKGGCPSPSPAPASAWGRSRGVKH